MYNREAEEGITMSTPAGYVYIPLFPARKYPCCLLEVTSEDNLL